ncbi:MAG TPA: sensor histidine kinase, partial [Acidimicrobiales bacterium]|nr:sensor histidine kinase [Acidimicrobiales bacterium]
LVIATATTGILMGVTAANNPFGPTGGAFDLIPFLMVAGCLGGIAVTSRRAYAVSTRTRAEQEARQRVDEERLRIARELHDVVAHTMATINVQAGVAAHLLGDAGGGPVRDALVTIRDASKEGLQELRSILQVLRTSGDADSTQPAPGADRIPSLIDGARAAGLPTGLEVSGSPRPLPAAVSLAAYRIVQESLTNAIRHAPGATAVVHLHYRPQEVVLTVTNGAPRQPPPPSEGAGHGLLGMRERAHSIGGRLEAGPGGDGGWQIRAWLPAASLPAPTPPPAPGTTPPAPTPAPPAATPAPPAPTPAPPAPTPAPPAPTPTLAATPAATTDPPARDPGAAAPAPPAPARGTHREARPVQP